MLKFKRDRRLKRRPVMLLEVLIAFALIVLCALPLIYPHVFILKSERKFASTVDLDHYVNILFVDTLEKLYKNEISWGIIESGKPQPISGIGEHETLDGFKLPFEGTYHFELEKKKVSKEKDHSAYLYKLIFNFFSKNGVKGDKNPENYVYEYRVVIERKGA